MDDNGAQGSYYNTMLNVNRGEVMKKSCTQAIVAGCLGFLVFSSAQADDVTTLIRSAEENYAAKNYSKALDDLDWARKEIVNQHLKSMKNLLPDEIDGMKGRDTEGGAVLGVRGIGKEYKSADGKRRVTINLIAGGGSSAGKGLGALMEMAASLGALDAGMNSKVVIEKGYKGQFLKDQSNNSGILTFNLNGGKMLKIETIGYPDSSMAEKVVTQLDIAKIEAAF